MFFLFSEGSLLVMESFEKWWTRTHTRNDCCDIDTLRMRVRGRACVRMCLPMLHLPGPLSRKFVVQRTGMAQIKLLSTFRIVCSSMGVGSGVFGRAMAERCRRAPLWYLNVWCRVLQYVAVYCSVLQCVAVCCHIVPCAPRHKVAASRTGHCIRSGHAGGGRLILRMRQ